MALNIISQPQAFSPGYNKLIHVASGSNYAQTNYKYLFDVYFTGSSSYDYRAKISPDTNNLGVFDASVIIKDFLSSNIAIQANGSEGFKRNSNSYKAYTVKVGEEYGSTPVTYANLTTSGTVYAYNGVFDFLNFKDYNQADYLLTTNGTTKKFLTNMPRTGTNIGSDENAWLYMMSNVAGVIGEMKIVSNLGTFRVNNQFGALAAEGDRFVRFPVGTRNILRIPSADFNSGAQPVINAATTSYTVTVFDSVNDNSETITFNVTDPCTKYEEYRLHFLNRLGGFDSFTFNRLSRKTSDIQRSFYKKTVAYNYNKYDRGISQFNTNVTDKLVLNSDFITEAQATWLKELITSPVVFLDDDTHGLVAVNILNANYEEFKKVNDKLFNLVLDIEYSQDVNLQTL